MMPRWQRAYVIAVCAIIGGAFAYTACDWGQWPRLTYLPISEAFTMKASPTVVSMNYIGIVAWGLGGAAVGAVVGSALCAAIRKPWPERALQLFGAWAITGILLAGCYYTWNLWPW
ncbi:MAG TPA: hypothetical protein VFS15_05145 [Kofleriaceae bacterium]|nr:hypothetical protein [Kofleriaceae bacterium]